MSNAVARTTDAEPMSLDDTYRLAETFVKSRLFAGVTEVAAAVVKMLAGRELGFGPFASMSGIHIVAGKAEPGANLLATLVKRSAKYDYRVTRIDNEACEITFLEGGQPCGVSSFTLDDARKAGTQNVTKFPRNMLFARALSNGVKWYCPDVENGVAVYASGEIQDDSPTGVVERSPALPVGDAAEEPPADPLVTPAQLARIDMLVSQCGLNAEAARKKARERYGVADWPELTAEQATEIEVKLEELFREKSQ